MPGYREACEHVRSESNMALHKIMFLSTVRLTHLVFLVLELDI